MHPLYIFTIIFWGSNDVHTEKCKKKSTSQATQNSEIKVSYYCKSADYAPVETHNLFSIIIKISLSIFYFSSYCLINTILAN